MADVEQHTPQFTVWHVGRQGEAACGMAQVINAYADWSFKSCRIKGIKSRDGSKGFKALKLFLYALKTICFMQNPAQNVVVVHLSQGGSFIREGLLLWIAKVRGFGTVAHLHGSQFVSFAAKRPWLVTKVLEAACKIIVLSEETQQTVNRILGSPRAELMPNAVADGNPVTKENLVVFGGHVSFRKGIDVLTAAWRLLDTKKGWRLVIAGAVLDPEVVDDKGDDDLEFVGAVTHNELMILLDRSSIAVLPSRDEAMPMFILEALARNNCVISTRVGGIPKVLSGGGGVLVEPGSIEQLASAFQQVIGSLEERNKIAGKGRETFERSFSAKAVYSDVENLWQSVLKTH